MLAWLGSIKAVASTIAAVVGFMKWLGDALQSRADRAAGRAEAQVEQAQEGAKVTGRMADEAAKPLSEDDAIARLDRGDG